MRPACPSVAAPLALGAPVRDVAKMHLAFPLWLQILLRGIPRDSASKTSRVGPQMGRAAGRLLSDSAGSVPERFAQWAGGAYAAVVRLLPRVAIAFVVAAVVLSLTVWIRTLARRRASTVEGTTEGTTEGSAQGAAEGAAARGVGALGMLVAALLAAWIVGATVVAAAILTFAVFYAAAAALTVAGARARQHAKSPEAVDLALTVARYALLILGIVEALDMLGLNLGGVIAGLGILGLAVGFAAQDLFANIISGFMILWDQSLRVGDWVRVKESEGRVRRITLRTTRIATPDDGILVIPNKEITGTTLYNFSLRPLTRVRVPVGVSYNVDIDVARGALLALVPDERGVIAEPAPIVAVTALEASTVTLELVFFIADPRDRGALRWRLFERILREFRRQGIAIPFPQLDVHLLDSSAEQMKSTAGNHGSP